MMTFKLPISFLFHSEYGLNSVRVVSHFCAICFVIKRSNRPLIRIVFWKFWFQNQWNIFGITWLRNLAFLWDWSCMDSGVCREKSTWDSRLEFYFFLQVCFILTPQDVCCAIVDRQTVHLLYLEMTLNTWSIYWLWNGYWAYQAIQVDVS